MAVAAERAPQQRREDLRRWLSARAAPQPVWVIAEALYGDCQPPSMRNDRARSDLYALESAGHVVRRGSHPRTEWAIRREASAEVVPSDSGVRPALFIVSIETPGGDGELVTLATVCVADDPNEAAQIALRVNDDGPGFCSLSVRRLGGLKIIPRAALIDDHILVSELDFER